MWLSADIQPRGPGDDFWYMPIGLPGSAGVRVSPASALTVSTLFACCLVLAQTLATVPVHLYKARSDRGKDRAVKHALYRLIHRRPNRWQTAYQWFQMMQWHAVLRYNAYSRILADRTGMPTELVPMHPDHVKVERFRGGDGVTNFRYRYKPEGIDEAVLTRGEVLHIRGLTSDGVEGFSPLEVQKDSIGEAIVAQRYSGRRMANDARPGGVLEWESHFKDDEERRKFRASWQEAQAGANQGKTAVLEKGMTWKDLGVKNTDLQFIELRELKAYDIASIFRMPAHKVGLLKRATFTNIEHQGIEFVTDTMDPWFRNWEMELSAQLLTEEEQEEGHFFEFLRVALLRGDAKARGEFYGKRFALGSLSPNDIREAENENPVDGGDRYFVAANLMPLDKVDEAIEARASQPGSEEEEAERQRDEEAAEAGGLVRREVAQLSRRQSFEEVEAFYTGHGGLVAERLHIDEAAAGQYCGMRLATFDVAQKAGRIEEWLASLEANGVHELLEIVREHRASDGETGAAPRRAKGGPDMSRGFVVNVAPQISVSTETSVERAERLAREDAERARRDAVVEKAVQAAEHALTAVDRLEDVMNRVADGSGHIVELAKRVGHLAESTEKIAAKEPAKPAVFVDNTVHVAAPEKSDAPTRVEIVSMPTRESESVMERDRQANITRVKQTEKDA